MRYIALYLGFLLLSGCCCLYPEVVRLPAGGQVVDASTGEPLLGAHVRAETFAWRGERPMVAPSPSRVDEVITDASGAWYLSPITDWGCLVPGVVPHQFATRYLVSAAGHRERHFDPWIDGQSADPPSRIELQPLQIAIDPLFDHPLVAR